MTACATHRPEVSATAPSSTAVRLIGGARWSADNGGAWRPVKIGDYLESGCLVQTAPGSQLVILLGEKLGRLPRSHSGNGGLYDPHLYASDLLSLQGDSILSIASVCDSGRAGPAATFQNTELTLLRGAVIGAVYRTGNDSLYEINCQSNRVFRARRGTTFYLTAPGDCTVYEGSGTVAGNNGEAPVEISSRRAFSAASGLVTNLPAPPSDWQHDLWLPSDPLREDWATAPGTVAR